MTTAPYEPPPDYPMVEEPWRTKDSHKYEKRVDSAAQQRYYSPLYSEPVFYCDRRIHRSQPAPTQRITRQSTSPMLRTRQYPEVAGIFGCDEQPALRRFTRHPDANFYMPPPPPHELQKRESCSSFKKAFFGGNWTFRDKKQHRPPLPPQAESFRRDERPASMHCESRLSRSRSEATARQLAAGECRVPLRRERQPSPTREVPTRVVVEVKPREVEQKPEENPYRRSLISNFRKSCPELDDGPPEPVNTQMKKRTRRARDKARDAKWRTRKVEDWSLDDVLLWLQHLQLDEVASLLIGYELRGEDLLQWNHKCLSQLGVNDEEARTKILTELHEIRTRGPEKEEKKTPQKTLFDFVRNTSYDQVLAVETALTPRDITVCHGRMGCLQVTKVNGANLPLRENDCLLEIDERPGEQFRSALMLTKLITASEGRPIRFVVLRQKSSAISEDSAIDSASSGPSTSPRPSTD